jgi:hypothetical protein
VDYEVLVRGAKFEPETERNNTRIHLELPAVADKLSAKSINDN